MSFAIKRPEAETARRRALAIEQLDYRDIPALDEERRACVGIWNEFCAEETARLAAKKAPTFAQVLPGGWVRAH